MLHQEPSKLAGKTVKLKEGIGEEIENQQYTVEDWWDKVTGGSWKDATGNPAALKYAMRSGLNGDANFDDEVLYGKVGPFGHLVHISEIKMPTD